MIPHPRPTVLLLAAPGTLAAVDSLLQQAGARPVRVPVVTTRPVEPKLWLDDLLRTETLDTVVLTSRAAVDAGIRPWLSALGRLPPSLEVWAVGPGTALALRRAGVPRIHRPRAVGADAVVTALHRQPPRRVLYLRSDAAGPRFARALRKQGHRVVDLVVYRVAAAARLEPHDRRELWKADLLVATSPSALRNLRRGVDRRLFSRLSRTIPLVALGGRTLRSARGHGFRHTSVAPSTAPQRFTRHLLRVLDLAER